MADKHSFNYGFRICLMNFDLDDELDEESAIEKLKVNQKTESERCKNWRQINRKIVREKKEQGNIWGKCKIGSNYAMNRN